MCSVSCLFCEVLGLQTGRSSPPRRPRSSALPSCVEQWCDLGPVPPWAEPLSDWIVPALSVQGPGPRPRLSPWSQVTPPGRAAFPPPVLSRVHGSCARSPRPRGPLRCSHHPPPSGRPAHVQPVALRPPVVSPVTWAASPSRGLAGGRPACVRSPACCLAHPRAVFVLNG